MHLPWEIWASGRDWNWILWHQSKSLNNYLKTTSFLLLANIFPIFFNISFQTPVWFIVHLIFNLWCTPIFLYFISKRPGCQFEGRVDLMNSYISVCPCLALTYGYVITALLCISARHKAIPRKQQWKHAAYMRNIYKAPKPKLKPSQIITNN